MKLYFTEESRVLDEIRAKGFAPVIGAGVEIMLSAERPQQGEVLVMDMEQAEDHEIPDPTDLPSGRWFSFTSDELDRGMRGGV